MTKIVTWQHYCTFLHQTKLKAADVWQKRVQYHNSISAIFFFSTIGIRKNPVHSAEKKCYKINKITKFEGDLLKTNEYVAPQGREILQFSSVHFSLKIYKTVLLVCFPYICCPLPPPPPPPPPPRYKRL